jgi:hypothetical protein
LVVGLLVFFGLSLTVRGVFAHRVASVGVLFNSITFDAGVCFNVYFLSVCVYKVSNQNPPIALPQLRFP